MKYASFFGHFFGYLFCLAVLGACTDHGTTQSTAVSQQVMPVSGASEQNLDQTQTPSQNPDLAQLAQASQLQQELEQTKARLQAAEMELASVRTELETRDGQMAALRQGEDTCAAGQAALDANNREVSDLEKQLGEQSKAFEALQATLLSAEAACQQMAAISDQDPRLNPKQAGH